MKVLIYGAGGVGGFIGSFLEKTDFEISYVVRNKRFEFLKSNGLILKSKIENLKKKNLKLLEKINQGDSYDIIIITVKLYDFDNVFDEIIDKVKGDFIILPMQNGIYAEEKISKTLGPDNTYGAVAQISAHIDSNQIVQHIGTLATFFVGSYGKKESQTLKFFCEKAQEKNLSIIFKENIKEKIWEKFIFLSAYSGITTMTQKTIGEIYNNSELKNKFNDAMKETFNLSRKFGVDFKRDPIEFWNDKIKKMPAEMTSSMYYDFLEKKKLELDWLSGSIIELAEKKGIKCETHKEIVKKIKT
ncbi:MAG: ketopantoate reductase family protein [Alphaproteobacteria bacterium]